LRQTLKQICLKFENFEIDKISNLTSCLADSCHSALLKTRQILAFACLWDKILKKKLQVLMKIVHV